MEINNKDDYSWIKVHLKNIRRELKILSAGVVKNFKRVTWHSKKGLTVEYLQVIAVVIFMSIFCFAIGSLISLVQ